jgi:glycerophosphoryl diester phosphodiesterase
MIVIAHRGFSRRYPENTMAAVRAAIRLGVDMVEVDVQQTRDGELVVFHDYRLDRIYGVHKRVRDAWRRELPGAPTLAEVLRLRFPLLVEIKGADPAKVEAAIGHRQDVIVFSIRNRKTERFRNRFGLCARKVEFPRGVSGLGLSRRLVTPAVVKRVHDRGLKLFVWTVNRPDEMRRLRDWGVDGLITDQPDVALAVRES